MRKLVLGLSTATLFLCSCSKNDTDFTDIKPPYVPVATGEAGKSYIKLTIGGNDLMAKDTIITYPGASPQLFPFYCKLESTPHVWGGGLYDKTISINSFSGDTYTNGRLKLVIAGTSFGSASTSFVDEYKTLTNSENAYSVEDIKTQTKYKIRTNSKITVSVSDNDHVEGKLDLSLVDEGGGDVSAKGEFKIYYR